MATLETRVLWDFEGKVETGGIPEIIVSGQICFKPNDFRLNSTTIQFLVDKTKVSEFILQSDYQVFLEERSASIGEISNESFQNTVKDLNKWVDAIQGFINLPKAPQANFEEEIEKDNTQITSKFTLKEGAILLFDANLNIGNDTLGFGSRVEATIAWPDFLNYVDAINIFVGEINFAKL